jgi:hypothetical protein
MFRDLCQAFQGVTYIGVTDAGFEAMPSMLIERSDLVGQSGSALSDGSAHWC